MGSSARRRLADTLRGGFFREEHVSGSSIGPYVVEALIACGGVGAVFRARHSGTGEQVALKVLLAGASASQSQQQRFLREAETLGRLSDPGIVRVLEAGQEESVSWMAMEYVEGSTLEDRLALHPSPRSVAKLLLQICRALAEVHALGVVHRDLKPSNVLLRADGKPVVTDFGLARDLTESSSLTQSGAAVGTPLYMAPEQSVGKRPTPATDVHALGVMLYEGLVGVLPWRCEGGDMLGLLQAIAQQTPRAPSKVNPRCPRGLDAICLKALAKKPAARYPDAAAMGDALQAFLQSKARGPAPLRGVALGFGGVAWVIAAALGFAFWHGSGDEAAPIAVVPPAPPPAPEPELEADPAPVPPVPPPPQLVVLQPGPIVGKDTYVRSDGLYFNDNFGSVPQLLVGDRDERRQRGDFRAFFQFDLDRIPPGAVVRRATLRLRTSTSSLLADSMSIRAQAVSAAWGEGTSAFDDTLDGVAWNGDYPGSNADVSSGRPDLTQPEVDAAVIDSAVIEKGAQWVELDVTAAVQGWLSAPETNRGLRICHSPEGPPFAEGRVGFVASDHRNAIWRPQLIVDYEGDPAAPAPDVEALRTERRDLARKLVGTVRALLGGPGVPPEATAAAQQAVVVAPFWGEAYFWRGVLRARVQNADAAVDLGLASSVLEPFESPDVYGLRAQVRAGRGDVPGALTDVARGLELYPGDPGLLELQAALRRRQPR